MKYNTNFNISSGDPFANIILILGFIAAVAVGIPLLFFSVAIGVFLIILGILMIVVGIICHLG